MISKMYIQPHTWRWLPDSHRLLVPRLFEAQAKGSKSKGYGWQEYIQKSKIQSNERAARAVD